MYKYMLILISIILNIQISAQEEPSYEDVSKITRQIGEKYFEAYISMNWDNLEKLLSDNASFQDQTAELVFGGILSKNKKSIMKRFREGYSSIEEMEFEPLRTFFSGNCAVFEGKLKWVLNLRSGKSVSSEMSMITILKVKDGLVLDHRDYADYHPFIENYNKATAR